MNILVTGGCGLIGHNVVSLLEQLDHSVAIIDNKTTYGLVPQDELDYLMSERLKKINSPIYSASIESGETVDYLIKNISQKLLYTWQAFHDKRLSMSILHGAAES